MMLTADEVPDVWSRGWAGSVRRSGVHGPDRLIHRQETRAAYNQTVGSSMKKKKMRAPWVPARIEPPDPLASLEEWQSYRAGLDALEARCSSVIPIRTG